MNRPNDTGNESAPAGMLRRRRRDRGIEDPLDAAGKKKLRAGTKRGGDLSIEDRIEAAGRELFSVGRYSGVLVGVSLAWATWAGHFEPVRSSLALLATAAIVVMVLGSDAFRQGGERGFGTPDRVTFGGTATWVMLCGGLGAMLVAVALPWLGPAHPWLTWLPVKVVLVGFVAVVGFVLGIVLSAPLVLAYSDVRARGREDESLPEEPMKARAGEFVADTGDPFSNDTLGRREQVEEFCERVRATATPVVWAVEGAWGSGRTAFSRMCAAVLRNDPSVAAAGAGSRSWPKRLPNRGCCSASSAAATRRPPAGLRRRARPPGPARRRARLAPCQSTARHSGGGRNPGPSGPTRAASGPAGARPTPIDRRTKEQP